MNSELLKTDDKKPIPSSEQDVLFVSKKKIRYICNALLLDASTYSPERSVKSIQGYVNNRTSKERLLYSEITAFVFGLNEEEQGSFSANIESLLSYVMDDNNKVNEDYSKIVIKIYDHFHLALHQKALAATPKLIAEKAVAEGLDKVMEKFRSETKEVETKYITVLGIFASIVLAFVGGLTFSTSVLQNINAVSIYRLLIVIDILGIILANVIHILLNSIFRINGKEEKVFSIRGLNIFLGIFGAIVIIAWMVSARSIPSFITQFLPWIN